MTVCARRGDYCRPHGFRTFVGCRFESGFPFVFRLRRFRGSYRVLLSFGSCSITPARLIPQIPQVPQIPMKSSSFVESKRFESSC